MEVSNLNSESVKSGVPDLKALHRVLTMFASELDSFCNKHDVTYYLMGGTALGAIRHQGFIPWDDDFDIFMDRENYLRFISACKSDLDDSRYYLQQEDTDEWPLFFSKVRLNDTLYIEREDEIGRIHTGLYIDVMCLHNTYTNKWMRYLHFLAGRALTAIALSKRGYSTNSWIKRLALVVGRILGFIRIKRLLLKFIRLLDDRDTKFVGHFFGRAPFRNSSFPRDYLGAPRRVPFENEMLPVPNNVEDYLTMRFGSDFMRMPSPRTLEAFPSHLISFDLGPYR